MPAWRKVIGMRQSKNQIVGRTCQIKKFCAFCEQDHVFRRFTLEITCLKCGKLIKETVKWLKAESRKRPFCNALIDTTEFRRGIDEATNRTHEMLRNLQGSLSSVKINIKL